MFMKNFYVLKLKMNQFEKVTKIENKFISWKLNYDLNQEFQYQFFKDQKYTKVLFSERLEKILKNSVINELNIILLILRELTLAIKKQMKYTNFLIFKKILGKNELLKYCFFYFLNQKNKELKTSFFLAINTTIFFLNNLKLKNNKTLLIKKNLIFSKKFKVKKMFSNKSVLRKFLSFKYPKKSYTKYRAKYNQKLNQKIFETHLIKKPKEKKDFLIKKLFYKSWFLNILQSCYGDYLNMNLLFYRRFNYVRLSLLEILQKIFLVIYLKPKFVFTLMTILEQKNHSLFMVKLLSKKMKKKDEKKNKNFFFFYINIKNFFSKKQKLFIYFEHFLISFSLLKSNLSYENKNDFSSNEREIQQKIFFYKVSHFIENIEFFKLNLKYKKKFLKVIFNFLILKIFNVHLSCKKLFYCYKQIHKLKIIYFQCVRSKINKMISQLCYLKAKYLIFQQSKNFISLNSRFYSESMTNISLKIIPNLKKNINFFILNAIFLKLFRGVEINILKVVGLQTDHFDIFVKLIKIKKNEKKNNNFIQLERKVFFFNDLISYEKFTQIIFQLNFLKFYKDDILLNFLRINLEYIFLNHFVSKLNSSLNNFTVQKFFKLNFEKKLSNFFFKKKQATLFLFCKEKLIKKPSIFFFFCLYEFLFLKSKKNFFLILRNSKFLSLCLKRFFYFFKRECFFNKKKCSLLIKTYRIKLKHQPKVSNNKMITSTNSHFKKSRITLNNFFIFKLFFKLFYFLFNLNLKVYQDSLNNSFIFYRENLLIFQKNYYLIDTYKNSIVQLIYNLIFSLKQNTFSHTLFILKQKLRGFTFYGFAVFQKIKYKQRKKFRNLEKDRNILKFFKKQSTKKRLFYENRSHHFQNYFYKLKSIKTNIIPSTQNLKNHINQIKYLIFKCKGKNQDSLINVLTPKIHKWSNYYKIISNNSNFTKLNFILLKLIWNWTLKRHSEKNLKWIKEKYFFSINNKKFIFAKKY